MNKINNGDLVTIKEISSLYEDEKNKALFTEGKVYRVRLWGLGAKITNDKGSDFYFNSSEVRDNLVKVVSNENVEDICKHLVEVTVGDYVEQIKELEKRVTALEKNEKISKLPLMKDDGTLLKLEWEGDTYALVHRTAKGGDIIVYPKVNEYWDDIIPNKPYKTFYDCKEVVVDNRVKFSDETECSIPVYGGDEEDSEESVLVYELVIDDSCDIDELAETPLEEEEPLEDVYEQKVEEAKKFLEYKKETVSGIVTNDGKTYKKGQYVTIKDVYAVRKTTQSNHEHACNVEFIVLENERKVVALLRGVDTNKVYARGIAVSYYKDVFNEDIGKAVALAKALKVDYSQFTNIPNPMGLEIGSVVEIKNIDELYVVKEFKSGNRVVFEGAYYSWNFIHNIKKVIK